jgi:uncharacterized protein with PIN domain
MIVDSSVIVAILREEFDAEIYVASLSRAFSELDELRGIPKSVLK